MNTAAVNTAVVDTPNGSVTSTEIAAPHSPRPASTSWWKILLAGLAAILASIALSVIVGAVVLGVSSSGPQTIRELPPVANAPDAALVMAVTPVGESGIAIDEMFIRNGMTSVMPGSAVISGSPRHISNVETPFDLATIYTWQEIEASTSPEWGPNSCFGATGQYTGSSSCHSGDITEPTYSHGTTESSSSGKTHDLFVIGLPADAAWVVVTSRNGSETAAQVVEGIAYLAWPAGNADDNFSDAKQVRALTSDFTEVWSDSIG